MKIIIFTFLFLFQISIVYASWERCDSGMYGGNVGVKKHAIKFDKENIFAITDVGLLFSSNYGEVWHCKYPESINCLFFKDSTILAGTNSGIKISFDYGSEWQDVQYLNNKYAKIDSFFVNGEMHYFYPPIKIYDFVQSGESIAAATSCGPFVSNDGGNNWSQSDSLNSLFEIYKTAVCGQNIIGATNKGIILSSDNGITWNRKTDGITTSPFYELETYKNYAFAAPITVGVIYVSTNFGETWAERGEDLPYQESVKCIAVCGDIVMAVLATINDYSKAGIYFSTNFGETWSKSNGLGDPMIIWFAFFNDTTYAVTYQSGLIKNVKDGRSWSSINNNLTFYKVRSFAVNEKILIAGTEGGGFFISRDRGETWLPKNKGFQNTTVNVLASDGVNLYAGTRGSGIFKSDISGKFWNEINLGLNFTDIRAVLPYNDKIYSGAYGGLGIKGGFFQTNLNNIDWKFLKLPYQTAGIPSYSSIAAKDSIIVASSDGYGIALSTDYGETWSQKNDGIEVRKWAYSTAISENSIVAGIYNTLYYSADNGNQWQKCNIDNDIKITSLATSKNVFYAGNKVENGGIYKSTDNGINWNRLSVGKAIFSIAAFDDYVFAGSKNRVFYSLDKGETWRESNIISDILSLCIFDNYLYAGTAGNGVWRSKLSDFGITSVYDEEVNSNYLYAFKPYPIPAASQVSALVYWDTSLEIENDEIFVYDIYGQKIAGKESITIDKLAPFKGNITWNCSSAPNGIYFIQINHGTISQTVKVMVYR